MTDTQEAPKRQARQSENVAVLHLVGGQYVAGLYQEIATPDNSTLMVVLQKPMEMQMVPRDGSASVVMHPFGAFYGLLKPSMSQIFPPTAIFSRHILSDKDPIHSKYKEFSEKAW